MAVRRKFRKPGGLDLWLAPAVIGMRMPLMALDAVSGAPNGKEAMMAVHEKALAATEGLLAAQAATFRAALSFWPEVLAGKSPSLLDGRAASAATAAAVRPIAKRVRSNYHRLSAKR
jgi:hypothetical protein